MFWANHQLGSKAQHIISKAIMVGLLAASGIGLTIQIPFTQATSPNVANAVVNDYQTSLTMPDGASLYLYGLVTGGGFPTTRFLNGNFASVVNAAGYLVAALAITTSNTNSYTTQTVYQAIGGVSVSGYASYSSSYGSNNAPAATSASDTFSVTDPGSLVVIIGATGSEQSVAVSGVPGLSVDATNFNGSCNQGIPPVIWIGHAFPGAGSFTVTMGTTQCAAGQTPTHAGDLIGVFVFTPRPIHGCKHFLVKTLEVDGRMMSLCRGQGDKLTTALN